MKTNLWAWLLIGWLLFAGVAIYKLDQAADSRKTEQVTQ